MSMSMSIMMGHLIGEVNHIAGPVSSWCPHLPSNIIISIIKRIIIFIISINITVD